MKGGASGQMLSIKYNYNDQTDDEDNTIWITVSKIFVNSTTPINIEVPRLGFETMTILLVNGDCESNQIDYDREDIN